MRNRGVKEKGRRLSFSSDLLRKPFFPTMCRFQLLHFSICKVFDMPVDSCSSIIITLTGSFEILEHF